METSKLNRFAVVIPAYNERKTIRDIVMRTLDYTSRVTVVDDGSEDGTSEALHGLPIELLRNERNMGKAASLKRGFYRALMGGVDGVITLDGDGQHRPEDIPMLVTTFEQYPNHIVIGARLHEKHNIPKSRYYANRFANFWIAWAAGYRIMDTQSGFRIYPAQLLRNLESRLAKSTRFVFESEILIEAGRLGYYSVGVPIAAIYSSHARPSHFRSVADIALIVRMVAWKLLSRGLYIGGLIQSLRSQGH